MGYGGQPPVMPAPMEGYPTVGDPMAAVQPMVAPPMGYGGQPPMGAPMGQPVMGAPMGQPPMMGQPGQPAIPGQPGMPGQQ